LSEDIAQSAGQSWEEVGALYEMLVGAEIVPEDDFCSAKQSYEMDILYSLRKAQNGFINFQPQVLDMDSELSLLVAPGQLLLDMVELESEDSVFTHRFGELGSETTILTRVCDVGTEMSKEEAIVWKCVDAATCLKELSEAADCNTNRILL